ncbi:MAG TPA: O-antigen ligase family protein [Bacteroidales bacterium]|nr:O-antigen ligase family protein [Bacteroidales bacterium]
MKWPARVATMLFLTLFAFPVFPLKFSNAVFMLLTLATLLMFIIKPISIGKTMFQNLVFILPFVPYLIEFFTSGFDPLARFEFEKKLFFFTAPLIIPVFLKITGFKNYKIPVLIFSLSVTLLTIYSFSYLLAKGLLADPSYYENGAFILRDNFEHISGLHPTYYSIFALCGGSFFYCNLSACKKALRIAGIVMATLLFVSVLLLAVRITIIILLIIILTHIFLKKISVLKKAAWILSTLLLMTLLIFCVPSLKARFGEIITWADGNSFQENTISQRKMITDCSWMVFSENILWGTGSRFFQDELNACYSTKGWEDKDQSFNPHNQYLTEGIAYGIFVLLTFLVCLFWIFKKIIIIPEARYFMIAVILVFFSESILERQMGVYFFGLLSILFYNIEDRL